MLRAVVAVLALGFCGSVPVRATAALSDTGSGVTLSATVRRPCEECGFAITVADRSKRRVLKVRSTIKNLATVHVLSATVGMLIGKVDERASCITAFRLQDGRTIGDAQVYAPSISPNGNDLVFIRFFPEHYSYGVDPASYGTSNVAFFDLRQPAFMQELRSKRLLRGALLYPNPPDGRFHSPQTGFAWSGSHAFSFLDLIDGYTYAVKVSFVGDTARVTRIKTNKPRVSY